MILGVQPVVMSSVEDGGAVVLAKLEADSEVTLSIDVAGMLDETIVDAVDVALIKETEKGSVDGVSLVVVMALAG